MWHTIGVNEAAAPRAALLGQGLPYYVKPMEAHAWTLPRRTALALSPKARKLLGLPWDHFLLHAHRVAALPRTPLDGARFVLDALLYGYEPYVHPRLFSNGLETAGLSPSPTSLSWLAGARLRPLRQKS